MTNEVPPGHVKIQTTMRPHEDLVVSEAEVVDLERQGLLKTDNAQVRKITGEGDK